MKFLVSSQPIRNVTLLIAVMVSGSALSIVFAPGVSLAEVFLLFVAPILAVILAPREHWLRLGAFIFLFAGVFGAGRIASDYGHNFLYAETLVHSQRTYIVEGTLSGLYVLIWFAWWLLSRRAKHGNNINT
jgi:hypothetical protein